MEPGELREIIWSAPGPGGDELNPPGLPTTPPTEDDLATIREELRLGQQLEEARG